MGDSSEFAPPITTIPPELIREIILYVVSPPTNPKCFISAMLSNCIFSKSITQLDVQGAIQSFTKENEFFMGGGIWGTENFLTNGKRHGPFKKWHCNGKLCQEGEYKNNLREGVWKECYQDGKLYQEGMYVLGQRQGLWKTFNETLIECGEYVDNKKNGVWRGWYPDGQPECECTYQMGKQHGVWKHWFCQGRVVTEVEYDNGVRKKVWKASLFTDP